MIRKVCSNRIYSQILSVWGVVRTDIFSGLALLLYIQLIYNVKSLCVWYIICLMGIHVSIAEIGNQMTHFEHLNFVKIHSVCAVENSLVRLIRKKTFNKSTCLFNVVTFVRAAP